MTKKSLFIFSLGLCLGFNFLFFRFLGYRTSWISYFLIFLLCAMYFVWRFLWPQPLHSLLRLALLLAVLVLSLVNFLHFKVLKTFVFIGYGLIAGLNRSEATLLLDYIPLLPFALGLAAVSLFIFFVAVEFHLGRAETEKIPRRLAFVFPVGLGVLLLTALLVIRFPRPSWVSMTQYHADLGPVGYLVIETVGELLSYPAAHSFTPLPAETLKGNFLASVQATRQALAELGELPAVRVSPAAVPLPAFRQPPSIVFYQLESAAAWAINQNPSPMPFLKKLMEENITVDRFFGNDCHTVGSEFTSLCSLLPDSAELISNKLNAPAYVCLPEILSRQWSYRTAAYHSNVASFWNRGTIFPHWGIANLNFYPNFRIREDDASVVSKMLQSRAQASGPQFDYFISFTSHAPHTDEYRAKNLVENNITIEPYPYPLDQVAQTVDLPEDELRNYFGFLTASDNALQHFFEGLQAQHELDNTIVVIFGDHRYYGFKNNPDAWYGAYNELPFALSVPGVRSLRLPITASHIDIAPTILDLLGHAQATTTSFVGQSMFSPGHANQAVGKCADEVYYFNSEIALQGNLSLDRYRVLTETHPVAAEKKERYLQKFAEVVARSNEIFSSPANFRFPDGTLLQRNSGAVYVLNGGKKRWISNEQIFYALGYSFNDVYKASDAILNQYPDGEAITRVDRQYLGQGVGLLRPSVIAANHRLVAHALGKINGVTGCNCAEALRENYRKGFRVFEADFSLTQDGNIVLFHDGNEENIGLSKPIFQTTVAEFKTNRFAGKYTLLDLDDWLQLLQQYPDAYAILDTKEKFEVIMPEIVRRAKTKYPDVLSRIIPQLYSPKQLEFVNNVHRFDDLILTLYLQDIPDDQLLAFVAGAKNITAVTMWWDTRYSDAVRDRLRQLDVSVFVHTPNDQATVNDFNNRGVGVYTDTFQAAIPDGWHE